MSLSNEIVENYGNRILPDSLYNSVYAKLMSKEVFETLKHHVAAVFASTNNKTILEIGAGQGGNINYLKACGFKDECIFVNELLPERIAALKKDYSTIKLFEGNAIELNFNQQFDAIYQSTVFTSVLKDEDRQALANNMWLHLKKDGAIFWYDFIYNNPKNKHVKKVSIDEIKKLFPEAKSFTVSKITLAPPIGRRVGRLYNLFNWPFLRSHVFVTIRK